MFARTLGLGQSLENGSLGLPPDSCPPGSTSSIALPHVIVGDEAFPLKTYLLRPYPGSKISDTQCHTFNRRHSRARIVVLCAFGILAQRFHCFRGPPQVEPENPSRIVPSASVLHNLLREKVMSKTARICHKRRQVRRAKAMMVLSGNFQKG